MQEIMTCTSGMPNGAHLNLATEDTYWFAGQNVTGAAPNMQGICGDIYLSGTGCTQAQTAEASHYGDVVDTMRKWVNGNSSTGAVGTGPVAPYIETDDGLVGTGSQRITPPEFQWADWDTIIHGARMLVYFSNTVNDGCGGSNSEFGFCPAIQSGQSVSMATQAADTNGLVENIAPIINSPFALSFASDNNGGYAFPTPDRDDRVGKSVGHHDEVLHRRLVLQFVGHVWKRLLRLRHGSRSGDGHKPIDDDHVAVKRYGKRLGELY